MNSDDADVSPTVKPHLKRAFNASQQTTTCSALMEIALPVEKRVRIGDFLSYRDSSGETCSGNDSRVPLHAQAQSINTAHDLEIATGSESIAPTLSLISAPSMLDDRLSASVLHSASSSIDSTRTEFSDSSGSLRTQERDIVFDSNVPSSGSSCMVNYATIFSENTSASNAMLVDSLTDRMESWSLINLKELRRTNMHDKTTVKLARRTLMKALKSQGPS